MMFVSISIATSVAIGLHFIRKLRRKFAVAPQQKGYTWGGPDNSGKMNINFNFESLVLHRIFDGDFPPDHYPIFEGDRYVNKELRIISVPTKIDRSAMHGVDVEQILMDTAQDDVYDGIRSYIDNLPPKEELR